MIFLSLVCLIIFVEELIFFKEKNKENLFYIITFLTFLKIPSSLINFSPFIFLFAGIFFFIKLRKNNEMIPINLAGLSKLFILSVPSFWAFFLGIFIVFFISPISSFTLKNYEKLKSYDSNNDNLIIVNKTGLWFLEKNNNDINMIRAEKVTDQSFSEFYNISMYFFDKDFSLTERIDSEKVNIKENNWITTNSKIYKGSTFEKIDNFNYKSKINLDKLKFFFSNPNTISIWNINDEIKLINNRGYSADEFTIKFHKYLSLPFFLFSMIILSTIFTINIQKNFNNFIYIFLGIFFGIVIYFLSDLSIALGKNQDIPLILSVWLPVILICVFSIINLTNIKYK